MAIIKMSKDNKYWGCGQMEHLHTIGENTNHYGNQYGGSSKLFKNRTTIDSTTECISKENEISLLKRHLSSHVHCSQIHRSQEMETTLVSIN
jgi:hypothetical protein